MRPPDPEVLARLRALGAAQARRPEPPPEPSPGPEHEAQPEPVGDTSPEAERWAPPTSLSGYVRASLRARLPAPLQGGRWDPGRRGLVLVAVLGLLAAAIAVTAAVRARAHSVPPAAPPVASGSSGGPAVDPLAAGVVVLVDVEGQVHKPGLVTLPAGARIAQALAAAGGVLPGTDTTALDLAQKVTDGQQLRVGLLPAAGASDGQPGQTGAGGSSGSTLIDLNTATAEQLDTLPHIGPSTAAKIIAWRKQHGPFTSVSQLQQVSGIGPSTYEAVASLVTV